MSHKLFRHSILSNARVWDFLTQVDAAEAQRCREAGCPRCAGVLHSATYPRKPHGLAAALRDDVRRFSLCCSVCRRRVKPASVRFFGRRFYVGALFVVVSALAVAGGVRLHTIARRCGVPASTLKRWRRWWLEVFPVTRQWQAKRGELAAPPEEAPLRWLVRIMRGRSLRSRVLRSLVWLGPKRGAMQGLSAAPITRTADVPWQATAPTRARPRPARRFLVGIAVRAIRPSACWRTVWRRGCRARLDDSSQLLVEVLVEEQPPAVALHQRSTSPVISSSSGALRSAASIRTSARASGMSSTLRRASMSLPSRSR